MSDQIPQFCPTCYSAGLTSRVQLYQINFEEAAVMCENTECPFPFVSDAPCPLTIPRNVSAVFATPLPPSSLTDGDSLASCSSASTWKSRTSTLSSFSSTGSTPPPRIASQQGSKPYSPAANRSTISQVARSITGTPRILSAQSSPASSTVSVTDREVELFMRNSYAASNLHPSAQLTPSPSPDVSSETTSQLFDDLEQLLSETLTQGSVMASEECETLVKDFLSEFQTSETQQEQPESRPRPAVSSSLGKKPVTRAKPSKRSAPFGSRPESSSRITVQLTDSGAKFVIQPPVSRPSSKSAPQTKRARTTKKPATKSDLNWVAETVSTKSRTPIKVNSTVKRFLMNLPNRPASV